MDQVRKTVSRLLLFSLVMLIVGMLSGVYTREVLRLVEKGMTDYQSFLIVSQNAYGVHGHILMLGSVLPAMLALIANAVKSDVKTFCVRCLKYASILMMVGTVFTLTLAVYKQSFTMFVLISNPDIAISQIDCALFWENSVIRSVCYMTAHSVLAIGLFWFASALIRTIVRKPPTEKE